MAFKGKKIIGMAMVLVFSYLIVPAAFAQSKNFDLFDFWLSAGDPPNSLYNELLTIAYGQINERKQEIAGLETRQDWLSRQNRVSRQLQEAFELFPERTALNPVISGKSEKDGIIAENLYFESYPGYFVTATFFYPKERKGKLPAILYCSGHTEDGYRLETYQHYILNFVKKGFAVLAFDPIGQGERRHYINDKGESIIGSSSIEHTYPGVQTFLTGRTPAHYFVWDGIRALDYLISRKEVDGQRIGVTGRSGGGTQTAYLAAVDERIHAAAPECYITSSELLLKSRGPQDAEQNLVQGLKIGIGMADYLEVRAPKPTLIVATTRDIFSIQGTRDVYREAKKTYTAFGMPDNLQMIEDDAEHSSTVKNREGTYAFFQKHLSNPGESADQKVEKFAVEALHATPSGNVFMDLKSESLQSMSMNHGKDLSQRRKSQMPERDISLLTGLIRKHTGYEAVKEALRESVYSGRWQEEGFAIEAYLLKISAAKSLPLICYEPGEKAKKTVLLLDEEGKGKYAQPGQLAEKLALAGYRVVVPDLSGFGELTGGQRGRNGMVLDDIPIRIWLASVLTGKSYVGIRLEEIESILRFVQKKDPSGGPVSIVTKGVLSSDALHAALLFHDDIDALAMINPLVSYQSVLEARDYDVKLIQSSVPGAMESYDLPQLVKALLGKKLVLVDPIKGDGSPLGPEETEEVYGTSPGAGKIGDNLNIWTSEGEELDSDRLLAWLGPDQ